MRWLVLLRWNFRGEHKTGLIIHAKDQREAEERVYTLLPPTFFRAENREIAICPTDKLLQALPSFIENLAPQYEESSGVRLMDVGDAMCAEAM